MNLTEREEALLTFYHCDHTRYLISVETDAEADKIAHLNKILSDKEISQAIKNYNLRTFGISNEECKKRKCFLCNDYTICDIEKRRKYEKQTELDKMRESVEVER